MQDRVTSGFLRRLEYAVLRRFYHEQGTLIVLMFHSIFGSEEEANAESLLPGERITVQRLHAIIQFFRDAGFIFVNPMDLFHGLSAEQRYVMLSVDDGYANFLNAVPVLEHYEIGAALFPVTNNILSGESFFWDVVYRHRHEQGFALRDVDQENRLLQRLLPEERRDYLIHRFGEDCLTPNGIVDRPLTPEEVSELAKHPLVTIGNHTSDHINLRYVDCDGLKTQLRTAQDTIREITHREPWMVAYPNGGVSQAILSEVGAMGFKFGLTTIPRHNRIASDLSGHRSLGLGRYNPWYGDGPWQGPNEIRRDVLTTDLHDRILRTRPPELVSW